MSGGEFRGNSAGLAPTSGGLFAEQVLTITASVPFTYLDGFELLGDLAVSDNLTLTTGIVSFVVDLFRPHHGRHTHAAQRGDDLIQPLGGRRQRRARRWAARSCV